MQINFSIIALSAVIDPSTTRAFHIYSWTVHPN